MGRVVLTEGSAELVSTITGEDKCRALGGLGQGPLVVVEEKLLGGSQQCSWGIGLWMAPAEQLR